MANITFSSPSMARDVTVYAVAGDRGTILAIAKANKIPIPFDCQDGECGSCLIEVKHLDSLARHAIALTEKEKEMLKQLGKITKKEIVDAEVNDMPPRHRLACQCFVRHEDVLVTFEGDKTLPAVAPHTTPAARRYKGGMVIATVADFLGYVAKVEADAAAHFDDLAKAMNSRARPTTSRSCSASSRDSPARWPRGPRRRPAARTRARRCRTTTSGRITRRRRATRSGRATRRCRASMRSRPRFMGERRCYEFYVAAEATAKSPEVAKAARPFIKAEGERVKVLEAWITREEWAAAH